MIRELRHVLDPSWPMFPGERRKRLAELAWRTAAAALPKRLRYWVLQVEGARLIGGLEHPHEEVPAVPFTVVLERASRCGVDTKEDHCG